MNYQSTTETIFKRMKKESKGTVFSTNDFLDIAIYDTVRSALSRLVNRGEIYRLLEGFFTIPYYMESVGEYSYPSPKIMAEKIANKNKWIITPFGDTALNYLGLSTQVPNVIEYLSTGPYKEYEYKGFIIRYKHTNKLLSGMSNSSRELVLLIQGIHALGKTNIKNEDYLKLKKYGKEHIVNSWVTEAQNMPKWIYDKLREIMRESL